MSASTTLGDRAFREVCRLAQNLARNCGYAVFPCSARKTPTRPERDGGQGYKDASADAEVIRFLWDHWPGPLIGVATGSVSNIVVLDLDVKHDAARGWWQVHRARMPQTRAQRTRSGGVHFYFGYVHGIRCTNGKHDRLGIDVRGDGGYVIYWFAAGLPCLDHSPPALWPSSWLTAAAFPPAPKRVEKHSSRIARGSGEAAVAGILRKVAEAPEGSRNGTLNWAAYRMGERVRSGHIDRVEAEFLLAEAARLCGLPQFEAARTIASGLRGAGA